jgi:hypothetical protein
MKAVLSTQGINMRKIRLGAIHYSQWGGWIIVAFVVLWSGALLVTEAAHGAEPPPGSYKVVEGKVDRGTFLGWQLYHTTCYGCHGMDAKGTDIAPSLVERVKLMTPREFAIKVLTRYRIALPATEAESPEALREAIIDEVLKQERGQRGEILMPAWESNTKVKPHVLDLYAYLSARADGALKPGRPKITSKN